MLCSIIIPVFNRENLINETIASILDQTYSNWECIFVDDGSSDSSYSILLNLSILDSRFRVYKRPIFYPKGANSCRNFGFTKCNGEFVQWFDSDDIMLPEMLENKIKIFDFYNIDIVICRMGFFKNNKNNYFIDQRKDLSCTSKNLPFEFFAGDFWFGTPQPIFKKSFLSKQNKLFDLKLTRHQETEFFVRLLINKPRIKFINDVLVLQRLHINSIAGNYSIINESKQLIIDYPAYKLLYLNLRHTSFLTDEVNSYFKKYFKRLLEKIDFNILLLIKIYIFGIFFRIFSFSFASKVLVKRLMNQI
jgi:glycosyltransferase involved in cell wall biosynthesis